MRALLLLVVIVVAGCAQPDAAAPTDEPPQPSTQPVVRFIVLGDMGTGEQPQLDVAAAMKQVCDELGCDFVVGVGDNIYEVGVTSHYDPQFITKFEIPYAEFEIPFYMSLGNHDNLGVRSGHAGGDFQVMYAQRTDRMHDIWVMPDRWYTHQQEHIQFISLDTNLVFDAQGEVSGTAALLTDDVDGVRQKAFIQEQLDANTTWRIMYGHHPLYSNGEHGDTGSYAGDWLHDAVCSTGKVDLLLTGHDHDLQWLAPNESCGNTTFIVSGAGAKTRPLATSDNAAYFNQGDTLGFAWVEIAGDRLTARFYDETATELFYGTMWRSGAVVPADHAPMKTL